MTRIALFVLALASLAGCKREATPTHEPASTPPTNAAKVAAASTTPQEPAADANLQRDQDEYVEDIVAFTRTTKEAVRARMKLGSEPLKDEWNTWEKQGAMTPERIKAFYKQTTNYIYELGEWHLFVPGKRASDVQLVKDLQAKQPKNILDFGGGVGLMSILLARAGMDVTLADLDSTTLEFARFRAERHQVPLKLWKADVDAAPPDAKYDVIMALDVLEHLPKDELHAVVDKLIKLKHAKTEIVLSAPFGKTAVHPMHMDADEDTKKQVVRLQTELPK